MLYALIFVPIFRKEWFFGLCKITGFITNDVRKPTPLGVGWIAKNIKQCVCKKRIYK